MNAAASSHRRPLRKRIFNSRVILFLTSLFLTFWASLTFYLSRVRYDIAPESQPYLKGEKPAIFCFWHGRLAMAAFLTPRGRPMHVLISRHNDGQVISAVMRRFGIQTVHGSRSKGAQAALHGLLEVTTRQENIAITPDGPRGPAQVAAPGAAYVAMKTGYPIIPLSYSSTRGVLLRSWDRFLIPWPFSRIVYVAAPPMYVPADAGENAVAQVTEELREALNRVTVEADLSCNVPL